MKTLLTLLLLTSINIAYAQTCNPKTINNTPNGYYTNNNNGTITDNRTKLIWKQCSEGQTWDINNPLDCTSTASSMTWQAALILADSATFTNNSNWQLPNIKQLQSIVASHCHSPSINTTHFPRTPANFFWSSSPIVLYDDSSFLVNFKRGDVSYDKIRTDNFHVRLVRHME